VVHLELPGKKTNRYFTTLQQIDGHRTGCVVEVSCASHPWIQRSRPFRRDESIYHQAILNNTTHTIETVETGIETIGRKMLQKGLPDLTFFVRLPTMGKQEFLDPFLPARLASYQAGKAVVQTTLPPHLAVSYLTLWPHPDIQSGDPKENLLDRSSCHTLRRLGLEAR
jgi:hypothetical protein